MLENRPRNTQSKSIEATDTYYQMWTSHCSLWHHDWCSLVSLVPLQSSVEQQTKHNTQIITIHLSSSLLPSCFSLYSFHSTTKESQVLLPTSGRPNPALAQLTEESCSLRVSATGLARLVGGNTGPWQVGHWYPAGAVYSGSRAAKSFRHDQWNKSEIERKLQTSMKCHPIYR